MSKQLVLIIAAVLALAGGWWFYQSRLPRFSVGETIPETTITLANGAGTVKLSEFKGKLTLVHFWGSWCGPCRHEIPELVKLYREYHDKGFEIISIAIERNSQAAWAAYIAESGMEWKWHSIEPGTFDGPMATEFNVKSIPATFLLNREGQVIATNPSPAVLNKVLMEHVR